MRNRLLTGPTIAEALGSNRDNFGIIRLVLALAVVVSHAGSVTTGLAELEPLKASTGFTLGEHAVNGFFAVSGFLVAMSFERRGWKDYALARSLRILPGLIAATFAIALVMGPALSTFAPAAYFSEPGTWRFIMQTLTTFKSTAQLPGVFQDNPFRFPMGTVWTLKYEILCYFGLGVAGALGLFRQRLLVMIVLAGLFLSIAGLDILRPDAGKGLQTALRLPFIFGLGAGLYVWRDKVSLSWAVVALLAGACVLTHGTFAYKAMLFAAEVYGVLVLALGPGAGRLPDPKADLSYGTYLYGWPVQQALHALFPATAAAVLFVPSLIITLLVAAASWYGIEKPALRIKARLLS